MFSPDIGMTFGLAKCGRLIVNRGKVKSTSDHDHPWCVPSQVKHS